MPDRSPLASKSRIAVLLPIAVVVFICLAVLAAIIIRTGSASIYSLDDPYIHLALAENIIRGHYGVNLGEPSAPSSSILWPLLLAPLSGTAVGPWVPLAINLLCAAVTAGIFGRFAHLSLEGCGQEPTSRRTAWIAGLIAIGLALVCNLIGMVFTGMEHMLQVMLISAILYAIVLDLLRDHLPKWVWPALVIAPLVRYETMAVVLPCLIYLSVRGRWKQATVCLLLIIALLAGFSLFLMHLGQSALPASVMAKSNTAASGGRLDSVAQNFLKNARSLQGLLLIAAGAGVLLAALSTKRLRNERLIAVAGVSAACLHLAFGRFGWYSRYEIYAWAFLLLMLVFLYRAPLTNLARNWPIPRLVVVLAFAVAVLGARHLYTQATTVWAVGNIAQQQHTMHRFVVNHWQKPVAINDLGWVAYRNDAYVLDLWGLASIDALKARKAKTPGWMEQAAEEQDVGLAMIYTSWLKPIPEDWTLVGSLSCPPPKITAAGLRVDFYATSPDQIDPIREAMQAFEPELPRGVKIEFEDESFDSDQ